VIIYNEATAVRLELTIEESSLTLTCDDKGKDEFELTKKNSLITITADITPQKT